MKESAAPLSLFGRDITPRPPRYKEREQQEEDAEDFEKIETHVSERRARRLAAVTGCVAIAEFLLVECFSCLFKVLASVLGFGRFGGPFGCNLRFS